MQDSPIYSLALVARWLGLMGVVLLGFHVQNNGWHCRFGRQETGRRVVSEARKRNATTLWRGVGGGER